MRYRVESWNCCRLECNSIVFAELVSMRVELCRKLVGGWMSTLMLAARHNYVTLAAKSSVQFTSRTQQHI